MDIFINGKQGAGKTRAVETIINGFRPLYGRRLSDTDVLYLHDPRGIHNVRLLVETIRAARVRAIVFDESIQNSTHLLIAVQAVKEFREQINADILAIYVQCVVPSIQNAPTSDLLDLAGNLPRIKELPIHAALSGTGATPASNRASIQNLDASMQRYPLTWDNTKQAFQAADLEADGQVICSAVNVYAFNGALRDGTGKRSKRFMLFELAEVVPVSNLHVAVDRMNTHYFETGTFEKRAFNAKNVQPATPSEVLEYLNAKYQYTLRTASNEAN